MHNDHETDEALATVGRVAEAVENHSGEVPVVVVKHPWWVTLKWPMTILAVAFLAMATSNVIIVVRDTNRENEAANRREVDQCDLAFTGRISEAAAASRLATSRLVAIVGEGLRLLAIEENLDQFDAGAFDAAITESEQANQADADAVLARESWRAAGQPMPCPIPPVGEASGDDGDG